MHLESGIYVEYLHPNGIITAGRIQDVRKMHSYIVIDNKRIQTRNILRIVTKEDDPDTFI